MTVRLYDCSVSVHVVGLELQQAMASYDIAPLALSSFLAPCNK